MHRRLENRVWFGQAPSSRLDRMIFEKHQHQGGSGVSNLRWRGTCGSRMRMEDEWEMQLL